MKKMMTSKKTKVASLVIASAIGFSAVATSAFAYTDQIRTLIYNGVNTAVTAIIPSINADLDAHQATIKARIVDDIANAKDYVLTTLSDYRQSLVDSGIDAQEAKYAETKYYFDQDVEGALATGKTNLDNAAAAKVSENTAETDADFEDAIEDVLN